MGGKLIFVIILSYLLQFKKDNPIFSAPSLSSTYSFHIRRKSKKKSNLLSCAHLIAY